MDQDKIELIGWLDELATDGQLQKLERKHFSFHPLTSPFGIRIEPWGAKELDEELETSWDTSHPDQRHGWLCLDLLLIGKAAFEKQISSRGKNWFLTRYKLWSACVDNFKVSCSVDVNMPRVEALLRAHRQVVDLFWPMLQVHDKVLPSLGAKNSDQRQRFYTTLLDRVVLAMDTNLTWWVDHRLPTVDVKPRTFWDYWKGKIKGKVSTEKRQAIESAIQADATRLGIDQPTCSNSQ